MSFFLPFALLLAGTYTWDNVRIVAGGFITGITFHPTAEGLLYVRTDIGGAYRRDPGSRRWIPLTDWVSPDESNLLGVEAIAVDPADANRLYLALGTYTQSWAGNGAIVRSTDRGATFQRTNLPIKLGANEDGRFAGERLVVDPQNPARLFFGSRNDGLWVSTDYAATWTKTNLPVSGPTNGVGIVSVVFDKATIYVGVSSATNGLYRSTDSGATWEPVPGQPSGLLPNHVLLSPEGSLYLTYGNAPGPNGMTNGAVWKFNPVDGAWANVTPRGSPAWGFGAVAFSASNPRLVIAATMDRWGPIDDLYRSTDSGATWQSVSARSVMDDSLSPYLKFGAAAPKFGWWMGALAIDPYNPGHVLFGTGATIWESSTVGNVDTITWKVGADGIEETAVMQIVSPPAGRHLISALGDIGGFAHDDLYVSPRRGMSSNPVFGTTTGLDFAELKPSVVVRTGSSNTRHGAISIDGGSTWTPFAADAAGVSNMPGTIAVAADGNTLVWSPTLATPQHSRDSGRTWTASQGTPNLAVTADRVNPSKFYTFNGSNGTVFVSTDGAANFSQGARGLPLNVGILRAVPGREGDLWLALSNSGLYHSTSSGAAFSRMAAVQTATAVGFGRSAEDGGYPAVYLAGRVDGVSGIYRSIDAGLTWVRINDDAHQYGWVGLITGDPRVFGRVFLGTNGRGIIVGEIAPQAGTLPVPRITAVLQGASFQPGIQSGAWATLLGENLAATTRVWSGDDIFNGALPLELDGVRVSINGQWAPVYYVSPTQINALVPTDSSMGEVPVVAKNGPAASEPFTATMQTVNPALFLFDTQNRRYPAAVATDGSYIGPPGLFGTALTTRPARPGEIVQFFGTGCGPTDPPLDPYLAVTSPARLKATVTATATVQYAGITGSGLCQFNLVIPNLPNGDHELRVTIDGVTSPSGVFLVVAQALGLR